MLRPSPMIRRAMERINELAAWPERLRSSQPGFQPTSRSRRWGRGSRTWRARAGFCANRRGTSVRGADVMYVFFYATRFSFFLIIFRSGSMRAQRAYGQLVGPTLVNGGRDVLRAPAIHSAHTVIPVSCHCIRPDAGGRRAYGNSEI